MRAPEVANLRSSILCSGAYVALCLNDHITALSYANKLLEQPKLSNAHRYLGQMYKGEALVAADRIGEDKGDMKSEKDGGEGSLENNGGVLHTWYPRDITKARALMQYNLATAYALRGDFQKALSNLGESAKAIGSPLPAHMYCLRLYLDLIEGRRKMAQVVIKDHFGHMTPNRVDTQAVNLESKTLF